VEPKNRAVLALYRQIQAHQRAGRVAELSFDDANQTIHIRVVGPSAWLADLTRGNRQVSVAEDEPSNQAYYFFADDLRPGSGIIRVSGGRPEGPQGTLTCLLSSKDGRDNYFAAAGHVLSNFWDPKEKPNDKFEFEDEPAASIYRYRKGFPATNSRRYLGKLLYLSTAPKPINGINGGGAEIDMDVGIVEILGDPGEFNLKQRTTCYGSFGEWPDAPDHVKKGQRVMKCGSQETHWTYAAVENPCRTVTIYGPDGLLYELHRQVILTTKPTATTCEQPAETSGPPPNWSPPKSTTYDGPFAVPGDSGTIVVDRESRRPVGMLIAGSVLDGLYVMTPIGKLLEFWTRKELVLVRA
jgi:hypothetical protein